MDLMKKYYENGQLKAKETYKNDKRDGPFETYYENGQIEHKYTYMNGGTRWAL